MKVKSNRIKLLKIFLTVAVVAVLFAISAVTVFAAGDVSSAIESTWTAAQTQIKNVVNNVVFPAVDMILAILFFVKLIWIIENTVSLNLLHLQSFSDVLYFR